MIIKPRDRIRALLREGNTLVRVLLIHPMDTGRAKDAQGHLIPAHFIQEIRCWRNDKEVLSIKCGIGTARNPYFSFHLAGGKKDDKISLRWVDNLGDKGGAETHVV